MTVALKHCGACRQRLPMVAFYPDKRTTSGVRPWCRNCTKAAQKKASCIGCGSLIAAKAKQCWACYVARVSIKTCECRRCGKSFVPKKTRESKYCSRQCAFADAKNWRHYTARKEQNAPISLVFFKHCKQCSKSFVARIGHKVYCSNACALEFYRLACRLPPTKKRCAGCGAPFWAEHGLRKHCSTACLIKKQRIAWRETPKYKEIKRGYRRRNRDQLRDAYVRRVLTERTNLKPKDIPQPLVELHRVHILVTRKLKELKK